MNGILFFMLTPSWHPRGGDLRVSGPHLITVTAKGEIMAKSTVSTQKNKIEKSDKPNAEFPFFAHATGRWVKKIRGKIHYFGPWNDPDRALESSTANGRVCLKD
jgi:hypothetical protein